MKKYAVITLMLMCYSINLSNLHSQNEEYGVSAIMFDFNRDFAKWNPLRKNLKYPSGISFIYSRQLTRYLSYTMPIHIGKETNLFNKDRESDNLNIIAGDLAIKLEELGSWNILSPYLITGVGAYALDEDGEGMKLYAKIPIGVGLNIKLYKRFSLKLHSTYNREIQRNRAYYIYGAGINVKLGKDPIRRKSDKDIEPILLASADQLLNDIDEDGVPDSLDLCPLEAGLLVNNGCPLYASNENIKLDSLTQINSNEKIIVDHMPVSDTISWTKLETEEIEELEQALENVALLTNEMSYEDKVNGSNEDKVNKGQVIRNEEQKMEEVIEVINESTTPPENSRDKVLAQAKETGDIGQVIGHGEKEKEVLKEISKEKEAKRQDPDDVIEVAIVVQDPDDEIEAAIIHDIVKNPNPENYLEVQIDKIIHDTLYIHDTIIENSTMTMNDRDNDGIADRIDNCPDIHGIIENKGCPKQNNELPIKMTNGVLINADDNIITSTVEHGINSPEIESIGMLRFPTGIAALQYAHIKVLNQIVRILKNNPDFQLKIYGHTDNEGSNGLNNRLSINRAKACFEYLQIYHVSLSQLTYKGMGESFPMDSNSTSRGRLQNRRVVFEFHSQN